MHNSFGSNLVLAMDSKKQEGKPWAEGEVIGELSGWKIRVPQSSGRKDRRRAVVPGIF
jgi:hypothetical protein